MSRLEQATAVITLTDAGGDAAQKKLNEVMFALDELGVTNCALYDALILPFLDTVPQEWWDVAYDKVAKRLNAGNSEEDTEFVCKTILEEFTDFQTIVVATCGQKGGKQ